MKNSAQMVIKVFGVSTLLLASFYLPLPLVYGSSQSSSLLVQAQPKTRQRIAILDFDFASTGLTGSDLSAANAVFGSVGPAKGVSNLLTNRLVQDGTYSVVERSRIEAILREQNLGDSGRVDAKTAAEIGRILGVEYVVLGSITKFNIKTQDSNTGVFGIGVGKRKQSAIVQLATRLVNTKTAEIIAVAEGEGVRQQKDSTVNVGVFSQGSSTNNLDTLLSDATEEAVQEVVAQLAAAQGTPGAVLVVSAVIADITGNQVVLNRGSSSGLKSGMKLAVERVTKTIKDPVSGAVLRELKESVGIIELTDVDANSALGIITQGSGSLKVGDVAKPVGK